MTPDQCERFETTMSYLAILRAIAFRKIATHGDSTLQHIDRVAITYIESIAQEHA